MIERSLLVFLTALALCSAQDREQARFGKIKTNVKTVARAAPRFNSQPLRTVEAEETLQWVEGTIVNDFVRVLLPKGPIGWIPADEADIVSPPAPPDADITAATACATSLGVCKPEGCASATSKIGIRNVVKKNPPTGTTPIRLTFTDLASIQNQTDLLFDQSQGREFDASERALLQGLTANNGAVGEGVLVRLTGFLSSGNNNPHPNSSGESVNCNLKTSANNDFHISVASNASKDEFDGIVIEMIPQDRPATWTVARLKKVKNQKRKIWIEGGLFYDNIHVVNSEPGTGSTQPKRFSLWEIHPITKFLVCTRSNNSCSNTDATQWVKLEDF
jgi:hypothetical protein